MQYDMAMQAGELAAKIADTNRIIAELEGLKGAGAALSGQISLHRAEAGNSLVTLPALTVEESAPVLEAMRAAFAARVSILNAQLAGL